MFQRSIIWKSVVKISPNLLEIWGRGGGGFLLLDYIYGNDQQKCKSAFHFNWISLIEPNKLKLKQTLKSLDQRTESIWVGNKKMRIKSMILFHYLRTFAVNSTGIFRTYQISLIELKAKIVNGLKPITIFKMRSIFAFCFVLNTPMKSLKIRLSYTSYKTEISIIV